MDVYMLSVFGAILLFLFVVSHVIGWITALIQMPFAYIHNDKARVGCCITISTISNIFQLYVLCGIPVYFYYVFENVTIMILSFVFAYALVLFGSVETIREIRQRKLNSPWLMFDQVKEEENLATNAYNIRFVGTIIIFIILMFVPSLIWVWPARVLLEISDWLMNINILGFFIRLFVGGLAGYYSIVMPVVLAITGVLKLLKR